MEVSLNYVYAVLGWVLWCTIHSALISITVTEYMKRKLGDGFRFYRLFYNVVSVATLIPLIYYSNMIREAPVFRWEGALTIVQILLLAASIYLFVVGGRHYSWAQFWGIAQIRAGRAHGSLARGDSFVVSGIHRIIRHPWYLGGILIVWTQDLSVPTILINMVISVYFIVGSFLEELKLVREFGDRYREYQRTVSMLFPWRWLKATIAEG
ncbi:MAG: NnrU family protein [Deltaproteobacteria bacterium]|nr:NnrU family protein [Deltaproteobacteria bacterium]